MVPEVFAPGVISTDAGEGCSVFYKDGTVFIYKQSSSRENLQDIYITEVADGTWSPPVLAPFDTEYSDGDFTIAPDEKTLFISSRRPVMEGGEALTESNIWVTERIEGEWSQPLLVESPVSTEHHDSYPCVTEDGTLYFFSRRPGGFGKSDMYRSRLENGKYVEAENLGPVINTGEHEWDPYIAPDESYLIFCSTKSGGFGEDDFYITFRNQDGSWSEPVNMGEDFNSSASENRPFVTADGKYLFFTSTKSGNRDIYWVDARVIETFRR
jgi:Tol biopolymer transport system component